MVLEGGDEVYREATSLVDVLLRAMLSLFYLCLFRQHGGN